ADMIVFADMAARRQRQLGHPQLILAVDLLEEPGNRRLELDLGNEPLGIDPHRAASGLRSGFVRSQGQGHQRQGRERLENIAPDMLVTGHEHLLWSAHLAWWLRDDSRGPATN